MLPYQTALAFKGFGEIPWEQRLRKAYETMGSPYGGYGGTAQQNLFAQKSMGDGTLMQKLQPAPQPVQQQPQSTYVPQNTIQQIMGNQQAATPKPFAQAFGMDRNQWDDANRNWATEVANRELLPQLQSQVNRSLYDYDNQASAAGANRFGAYRTGRNIYNNQLQQGVKEDIRSQVVNPWTAKANSFYTDIYNRYGSDPNLDVYGEMNNYKQNIQNQFGGYYK
jgi:formaldehyde-activating enzyme involved in methanogenesis